MMMSHCERCTNSFRFQRSDSHILLISHYFQKSRDILLYKKLKLLSSTFLDFLYINIIFIFYELQNGLLLRKRERERARQHAKERGEISKGKNVKIKL